MGVKGSVNFTEPPAASHPVQWLLLCSLEHGEGDIVGQKSCDAHPLCVCAHGGSDTFHIRAPTSIPESMLSSII